MRAREQLRNILLHHGWHAPEVDMMLDAFAHELAEQIRETATSWGGVPDMDAHDAADLIDPAAIGRDAEGKPA